MKKIIFASLLAGTIFLAGTALAATSFSFSSTAFNVAQGQSFVLRTTVDPQGTANYTVKLELQYPADILEVRLFTLGNSWMPVSQPGYDLIDNTSGVLIKSAGYPGGLSSSATFGTVSFYAKKSGNGTIQTTNNSFALDANSQNVLSGTVQASVAIAKPSVVPVPSEEKPTITEEKPGEEVQPTTTAGAPKVAEQLPTLEKTTLLAAIADLFASQGGKIWLFLLGFAAGLVILLIFIKKMQSKKS
jgi:hypothetical protein